MGERKKDEEGKMIPEIYPDLEDNLGIPLD
jgi:hypothetical protein